MPGTDTTIVFAYADKTMLRISGISVHGLDAGQLEKLLTEKLGSLTRVIGVTGTSIDLDVYGLEEESILRDGENIIKAVALADGITLTDLAAIACSGSAIQVEAEGITRPDGSYCARERWKHGA